LKKQTTAIMDLRTAYYAREEANNCDWVIDLLHSILCDRSVFANEIAARRLDLTFTSLW
jgi:hypothetical protein